MKAISPRATFKARAEVGWPKLFKSQRVAVCLIDLSESGHLDVPLDKLPDFLRAKGYPQIAWAVEEQVKARHVPLLLNIEKDDSLGKRRLIKGLIQKEISDGR